MTVPIRNPLIWLGFCWKELDALVLMSPRTTKTDKESLSHECRKLLIGRVFSETPWATDGRLQLKHLWGNAFGGVLLRLSAFGAIASILGQRLREKRLWLYVLGGHVRLRRNGTPAARVPSAGQDRTTERTRCIDFGQRLRRCGRVTSAEDVRFRPCAFGGTPSALRESDFGGRRTPSVVRLRRCGEKKFGNRPEAKSFAATPSAIRLRRCTSRAKSTDDGGNQIQFSRLILGIAISISLERRLRSKKSAERNERESRDLRGIAGYRVAAECAAEGLVTQLQMIPLKLPPIGLRAFRHQLTAVKLDFLLWGWNWVCQDMVREWLKGKDQPTRGFRPHPERWEVCDWEQVLGRCAGEEGHLLFECESIKVTKEEEISFGAVFKNSKSSKNGYKTRDYKDRFRRNVAVALIQLLKPQRTTYMTSWQVAFVELVLAGALIHWAPILWKATRQHAFEEKGGSINHLSPFLINFYRSMGCLTETERVQFPLLSRSNPGRYVKDVEVDIDKDETSAYTPSAQPRAEGESLRA
ncbi:hypothetical protein AXG93_3833s1010 [Marchantia polymorpha subsp. ruderalis]|uniref:Uncharacterized protein n=1 Tax=Marchantia polymorpha subsp. ruderalis TaxID=1480154 RepID=A0A176VLE2_MARPO|nr:hypothetical protein AXG93_3833s1010 [Marchantia polymorpha subsp. ruderalis]